MKGWTTTFSFETRSCRILLATLSSYAGAWSLLAYLLRNKLLSRSRLCLSLTLMVYTALIQFVIHHMLISFDDSGYPLLLIDATL